MGKYDDISDQLVQYVSRATAAASVNGTENELVPDDTPSVIDNQGEQEKEMTLNTGISNQPQVRLKVYTVFINPYYYFYIVNTVYCQERYNSLIVWIKISFKHNTIMNVKETLPASVVLLLNGEILKFDIENKFADITNSFII